jgi:hypothetical protein
MHYGTHGVRTNMKIVQKYTNHPAVTALTLQARSLLIPTRLEMHTLSTTRDSHIACPNSLRRNLNLPGITGRSEFSLTPSRKRKSALQFVGLVQLSNITMLSYVPCYPVGPSGGVSIHIEAPTWAHSGNWVHPTEVPFKRPEY